MSCMRTKAGHAQYGAPVSVFDAIHWSPNGRRGRHDGLAELL